MVPELVYVLQVELAVYFYTLFLVVPGAGNVLETYSERDKNDQSVYTLEEDHLERTHLVLVEDPFFSDQTHTVENNRQDQ